MNIPLLRDTYYKTPLYPDKLEQCVEVVNANVAAFNRRGSMLAVGTTTGKFEVFDFVTLSSLRLFATAHNGPIVSLCWSRDSRKILSASRDQYVRLWDTASKKKLYEKRFDYPIVSVHYHPRNVDVYLVCLGVRRPILVSISTGTENMIKDFVDELENGPLADTIETTEVEGRDFTVSGKKTMSLDANSTSPQTCTRTSSATTISPQTTTSVPSETNMKTVNREQEIALQKDAKEEAVVVNLNPNVDLYEDTHVTPSPTHFLSQRHINDSNITSGITLSTSMHTHLCTFTDASTPNNNPEMAAKANTYDSDVNNKARERNSKDSSLSSFEEKSDSGISVSVYGGADANSETNGNSLICSITTNDTKTLLDAVATRSTSASPFSFKSTSSLSPVFTTAPNSPRTAVPLIDRRIMKPDLYVVSDTRGKEKENSNPTPILKSTSKVQSAPALGTIRNVEKADVWTEHVDCNHSKQQGQQESHSNVIPASNFTSLTLNANTAVHSLPIERADPSVVIEAISNISNITNQTEGVNRGVNQEFSLRESAAESIDVVQDILTHVDEVNTAQTRKHVNNGCNPPAGSRKVEDSSTSTDSFKHIDLTNTGQHIGICSTFKRVDTKSGQPWNERKKAKKRKNETQSSNLTYTATFDHRGKVVACGTSDGTLALVDTDSLTVVQACDRWKSKSRGVVGVTYGKKDGALLVNCGSIMRGYTGDLRHCEFSFQELVDKRRWKTACVSPDGKFVVSGSEKRHHIYVWDVESGVLVRKLEGQGDAIVDMKWHPNRPILVTVSELGFYVWTVNFTENWVALAANFTEIEENVELDEREDENDIIDGRTVEFLMDREAEEAMTDICTNEVIPGYYSSDEDDCTQEDEYYISALKQLTVHLFAVAVARTNYMAKKGGNKKDARDKQAFLKERREMQKAARAQLFSSVAGVASNKQTKMINKKTNTEQKEASVSRPKFINQTSKRKAGTPSISAEGGQSEVKQMKRDRAPPQSNKRLKSEKTAIVRKNKNDTQRPLGPVDNPFLDAYTAAQEELPNDIDSMMDPSYDANRRAELLQLEPEELAEKFAWAIPDERALRICKEYGPMVEVGCGLGYWARLLQERGVDMEAFDIAIPENPWTSVRVGGPSVLGNKKNKNRTLFLCYPDDFERSEESMALQCLKHYKGDTIVHVGETFGQSVCRPGPWGRSSGETFQTELASSFHRVLQVPLPCWRSAMDCLSVWRRTQICIVQAQDSEDDEPEEMQFAHIPMNERLDMTLACESTKHLL
eukprot:CFRG3809T1